MVAFAAVDAGEAFGAVGLFEEMLLGEILVGFHQKLLLGSRGVDAQELGGIGGVMQEKLLLRGGGVGGEEEVRLGGGVLLDEKVLLRGGGGELEQVGMGARGDGGELVLAGGVLRGEEEQVVGGIAGGALQKQMMLRGDRKSVV